jgi:two-component system alkaline phosphatase synthesis response regulator PhoP
MGNRFKILVVEDDPDDLELVKMALKDEPYDISVAHNGEEGVRKARADKPDAILLDIMMPEKDGFKACEELKKDAECARIPVLVLTAVGQYFSSTRYAVSSGMRMEAEDYIEKPVDGEVLRKRLAHFLKRN